MNHEATIATLNAQLDNCAKDLYEKDKRIAELERQLAEASAPAVEQQPVKPWEDRMQEYFAQGSVRMRTPAYFMADEIIDWRKTSPAAPQAADTDKVREALPGWERGIATVTMNGHQLRAALDFINPDGPEDELQAEDELTFGIVQHKGDDGKVSTGLCCWNDDTDGVYPLDGDPQPVDSMAAQAPVREVPGYRLVPIELTDEMRAACINACYADHIDEDWAAMLAAAPLPAAPVQQEGV